MIHSVGLFRLARIEDGAAIRAMQARAMRRLGAAFYPPEAIEAFLSVVGTVDDSVIREGHYFIAATPCGRIVASGGWSRAVPHYDGQRDCATAGTAIDGAIVRSVYVDPDMARRGLATGIMRTLERDAARSGVCTLTLTASLSGLPLYLSSGYRPTVRGSLDLGGIGFAFVKMEKTLGQPAARAVA